MALDQISINLPGGVLLSILAGAIVALVSGYVGLQRERHQRLLQEVYRPMFEELKTVTEGRIPNDPKWREIDDYLKYRLSKKFQAELDNYTKKIDELWSLEAANPTKPDDDTQLPEVMFEWRRGDLSLVLNRWEDDGGRVTRRTGKDFKSFYVQYQDEIRGANGPEELRKNLMASNTGSVPEAVERWDDWFPDWPTSLWALIVANNAVLESHKKMEELGEEIRKSGEELRDKLESKIDAGILKITFGSFVKKLSLQPDFGG